MPRPAIPKNIHILKGTAKQHPERMRERENEPENKNPIGEPSDFLNETEKTFFKEIVNDSIEGVLGEADRIAVEQAAKLLYICRGMGESPANAAEQNQLFRYLSQFGMTPADRSKISLPGKKQKNKFADD